MNRRKLFSKFAAISAGTLFSSFGIAQTNLDRQIDISELDGMKIMMEVNFGKSAKFVEATIHPIYEGVKIFDAEKELNNYIENHTVFCKNESLHHVAKTTDGKFAFIPLEVKF